MVSVTRQFEKIFFLANIILIFLRTSLSHNCQHSTGLSRRSTMGRKGRSSPFVCLRTGPFTRGSGLLTRTRRTEGAFRSGLMGRDMTGSGEMEWPMAMEGSYMPKVTCTKESGLRTKPMDTEFIRISMEAGMKGSGSRINSMGSVWSSGLMAQSMRASMSKE